MSRRPRAGEGLSIGDVAGRTGVAASAIRYWEEQGLLERAPRRSGRRVYSEAILDRVALIQLAQRAGFTIAEIRSLLRGFPRASAGERWRSLVERKQADAREQVAEVQRMLGVLDMLASCDCPDLDACGAAARRGRSFEEASSAGERAAIRRRISRSGKQRPRS